MICSDRFKKLANKYGFRIKKVSNTYYINNKIEKIVRRPDILSVQYQNNHIMTIPKKMYGFIKRGYHPIGQNVSFEDFFRIEHKLKNWNLIIKRTPYIQNL
jgi:hypothetical protein